MRKLGENPRKLEEKKTTAPPTRARERETGENNNSLLQLLIKWQ